MTSDLVGKGGPSYTFKTKKQLNLTNDNPGPGNYEPSTNYTKDKVASFKMGSSKRGDIVSKEA